MAATKKVAGTKKTRRKSRRKVKTWEWVVIGAVGVGALWVVWDWQRGSNANEEFLGLAQQGAGALARVDRRASIGAGHTQPGESVSYDDAHPTSGRHDPSWVDPGVYDSVQPAPRLVHSVEHGMVVVYYDEPTPEVMRTLREWAGLYNGAWSGIVVAPSPGLGQEIVLTAWNRSLRLDPFDPAAAAAFIDRFRGRGPENPVR